MAEVSRALIEQILEDIATAPDERIARLDPKAVRSMAQELLSRKRVEWAEED